MKKLLKITGISLLVALVALQLYRPAKNVSEETPSTDIVQTYGVPADVAATLQKACYDCHSNNTHYPWYSNIQPVGMWLAHHVDEGKDELNFSEFGNYKPRRKAKKMHEIVEEIEEGEMPLESYTLIHGEAKLTANEKQKLIEWAKGLEQRITLEQPAQQ